MKPPFLDTNILIYAFTDDPRAAKARECMTKPFILSTEALNEFSNVALGKLGMTVADVRRALSDICLLAEDVLPLDRNLQSLALDIVERHRPSFYDGLMLAAALSGRLRHFPRRRHAAWLDHRSWSAGRQSVRLRSASQERGRPLIPLRHAA